MAEVGLARFARVAMELARATMSHYVRAALIFQIAAYTPIPEAQADY